MKNLSFTLLGMVIMAAFFVTVGMDRSNTSEDKSYEYLETQLDNAKSYTLEVIEGFPEDDFGFKPGDEMRTFGAQAFHIAYSLEWFNAQLKGEPIQWDPGDEERMNKEELIAYTTEQFDAFIGIIKNAEEGGRFTAGVVGSLRHNSHHRGQMVAYYRANGMAPPQYK
jgi:uncharacterized damage-inducible protein DinB